MHFTCAEMVGFPQIWSHTVLTLYITLTITYCMTVMFGRDKFGESLHQKWLAKVWRISTTALRRLLLLCNHHMHVSKSTQ